MPSVTIITAYPGPFRLHTTVGVYVDGTDIATCYAETRGLDFSGKYRITLPLPHGPEWGIGAMQ